MQKGKEEPDGETWKFNKTRQVWLLKNCYNLHQVPSKHFKIMLKYMAGLQGKGRKIASDEAIEIVEDHSKVKLD